MQSIALFFAAILLSSAALADDLEGRILAPIDALEGAVGGLLGSLLTDKDDRLKGDVDSVTVRSSTEHELVVNVTLHGLQGSEVRAHLEDSSRKRLKMVVSGKTIVPAAGDSASQALPLTLSLKDNMPEGFEVRSARLVLELSQVGKRLALRRNIYALDKRFSKAVAPENQVVHVVAEPIGRAIGLKRKLASGNPGARPTPIGRTATLRVPLVRRTPLTRLSPLSTSVKPLSVDRGKRPAVAVNRSKVSIGKVQFNTLIKANQLLQIENAKTIAKLPTFKRIPIDKFKFAVPNPNKGASDPSFEPVLNNKDLLDGLESDVALSDGEVLRLLSSVFADKNSASGYYYYVPRGYGLLWDDSQAGGLGLGLRINYERTADGAEPKVRMAALLSAHVDRQEIDMASTLLEKASKRNPRFKFVKLAPFPLAAPPQISLAKGDLSGTSGFGIPADQIAITGLSDALEVIELSWVTDQVTAQNMKLQLKSFGIRGEATFVPPVAGGAQVNVPVSIQIDEPEVYGSLGWSRNTKVTNRTPFPIRLRNLHTLMLEGNRPIVYSWSLGDVSVPQKARINIDARHVPRQVDSKALRMWVEYDIDRSCETCVKTTLDTLLTGDLWPDAGAVTFRALTPLEDVGAVELQIRTRSQFFDTADRTMKEGPILFVAEDRSEQKVEPVFLIGTTTTDDDSPLLEFAIDLILPDGRMVEGVNWLPANSQRIIIGSHQVEQSIGKSTEEL